MPPPHVRMGKKRRFEKNPRCHHPGTDVPGAACISSPRLRPNCSARLRRQANRFRSSACCVMRDPRAHSPGAAYESGDTGIRNRVVAANRLWIMRKMQADIAIRHEEPCSQAPGRYEPVGVRETELRGAGPEVALIERQVLQQRLPEAG